MTTLIDHHPCDRCAGTVVEALDDDGSAACCFCGLRLRLCRSMAVQEARQKAAGEEAFRLQYGRFAGLSLAEAAAQPNGMRYLEALARGNDKIRHRVEDFLLARDFSLDSQNAPETLVPSTG